jgi:AbrB family looped-hinge helix DNA binding protein
METTIDMAGRLVIPKAIRDEIGLAPGAEVTITAREGRVEIEPVARKFTVVKKGPFAVIEAPPGTPTLTHRQVRETIRKIRERRG